MKQFSCVFVAVCVLKICAFSQQSSNALLWRIGSKQGGKPSYLYGTMHVAQKKYMSFTDSVYKAVAETDVFFGELDYNNMMAGFGDSNTVAFFEKKVAFLDSVSKTPEWKAMVGRMNKKYNVNINPDSLDQFAAFGTKITADMFEPEPGVQLMDIMLSDYAQSLGKKTGGIETFIRQIDMLYSVIAARLQDPTLDFDAEKLIVENFKRYYSSQRLDSINAYLQQTNANYRNIIFTQRNITMADSIEKYSNEGPAFFAIGCGHLPGNDGVIALLQQKGFVVTPILSDNKISLLLLNELKNKWQEKSRDEKVFEAPPVDADKAVITDVSIEEISDGTIKMPPPPKRKTTKKKMR